MAALRLAFLATFAALAFPAASLGVQGHAVPPGLSGANQYTETLPGPGGEEPTGGTGGKHQQSAAKALGNSNAEKLESLGQEGRAAAELAASTAPTRTGSSAPRHGGSTKEAGPAGADPAGQLAGGITGSSDSGSGGMGIWLPLLIVALAAGAVGFAFARRQTTARKSD